MSLDTSKPRGGRDEDAKNSQANAMVAPMNSRMAPTMERTNPAAVQAQNLSWARSEGGRGELDSSTRRNQGGREDEPHD